MPVVQDYTAILSGYSINETVGKGAFYTYSFLASVPTEYYGDYSDAALATFRPLTAAEKAAARQALDAWASISGLTLFEVSPGEGDIRFGAYDMSVMRPGAAGFAGYPSGFYDYPHASDVFLDRNYAGNTHTLLHEIGHALGFKHTFEGDVTLSTAIDNYGSSVMSYTSGGFSGNVLGTLDRQAVQYLYGDANADGKQVASWNWNAATYTLTQTGFAGADKIGGVGTTDIIFGMGGDDIVQGRGGNDQIDGGDGDDDLRGGAGDDFLLGGIGKDRLDGAEGKDRLEGGDADDSLFGGAGDDTLFGGAGSDYIYGGDGNNRLEGDGGNDTLSADSGQSILNGGDGDDRLYLYLDSSPSTFQVDGGAGSDTLGISISYSVVAPIFSLADMLSSGWTLANVEGLAIWGNDNGARITGSNYNEFIGGGVGNDVLAGGGGADNLDAKAGNDELDGGDGNDYLTGGEGDDRLKGGAGADTMDGGLGADTFVYSQVTETTLAVRDSISHFQSGVDKIDLSALAAPTVTWTDNIYSGSTAHFSIVTVAVGNASMSIFVDGLVALSDFILTPSSSILGTSGNDNLVGTAGPDTIRGNGGNDSLQGLGGNDTLDGGPGADVMSGGAGDDIYVVDDAGDVVNEAQGQGSDTVYALSNWTLTQNSFVETLSAIDWSATNALNLTGNSFANVIYGNAGANVLNGAAGADTMTGFAGDDTYIVDDVGDAVNEAAGQGKDIVYALMSWTLTPDSYVETLSAVDWAATAALNLTGNALNNAVYGNAGANLLNGAGGADVMTGFGGSDVYVVDNAGDVVNEASGQGVDTVYALASWALTAGSLVETLSAIDWSATNALNLTGNEFANAIYGNAGANVLNGGASVDTMTGFGGDDIYIVDNVGDVVNETQGQGNDIVYALSSWTLTQNSFVETLSAIDWSATNALNLTGNSFANVIYGNAGANVLDGMAGNDVLIGGAGADIARFHSARAANVIVAYGGTVAVFNSANHETDRMKEIETLQFDNLSLQTAGLPEFRGLDYIATYDDLSRALGANAEAGFAHFVNYGFFEGRTQDGFDGLQYLATYDDLIRAFGADDQRAAQHFISFGLAEGRVRDGFDGLQYLASYDDLIRAFGADDNRAAQHFIGFGLAEGRVRDGFDGLQYVAGYDDLIRAFGTDEHRAAEHFLTFGFNEGRARDSFDGLQYIASYGDLIRAFGVNEHAGAQHFISFGSAEGRARDTFDAAQYLANYGDLRAAFGNDEHAAAVHFIAYGYFEGRTDDPLFGG